MIEFKNLKTEEMGMIGFPARDGESYISNNRFHRHRNKVPEKP